MQDVRREDLRLFLKELGNPGRIFIALAGLFVIYLIGQKHSDRALASGMLAYVITMLSVVGTAFSASVRKRFRNRRMEALWSGCQDRMARFEEVLRKMKREYIAEFKEMPSTIRKLSQSIYIALRRADVVADEVAATEAGMLSKPPVWQASGNDAQSQELYRIADKNIAEYRQHFAGIMAGVQRTEAQSAVFMTTLDTLRMKMIGYRLVNRSPELSSHDFLEAIAEARSQLQAIDTALEELDLGHYPKTITVIPPPPTEEHLRLNG